METISLNDLGKKLRRKEIKNYKLKDSNKIVITDINKNTFIVDGLNINQKGSHLYLQKDNKTVVLSAYHRKTKTKLIISIGSLIITIFSFIFTTTSFLKKPLDPIQDRINELDNIQSSLSVLNKYIDDQRNELNDLNTSIKSLQHKKKTMENIIALDEDKIQSILEYQNMKYRNDIWINRFFSFVFGILASVIGSLIINFFKSNKYIKGDVE